MMNKKLMGYGSIALAALLLFLFVLQPFSSNEIQEARSRMIPNIASPGLSYQGINLTDHSQFDPVTNTCTANHLGMQIKIWPCVAQTPTGSGIQHNVNFTWTGAQAQNTSWIFIYDGGQLQSGSMGLWKNVSHQETVQVHSVNPVSNYILTGILNFTNLGAPNASCQLGSSMNNTQMYRVNLYNATAPGQFTPRTICFTQATAMNATTFSLNGFVDAYSQANQTVWGMGWQDITNQIQYMGYGLLNDSRAYYKVQDVQFQPGQTYSTLWTYTPLNRSEIGKWHIVGYNSNIGLTQSLVQNQYIYVDPWWNNNWQYKKAINISNTAGRTINNFTLFMTVPYVAGMSSNFSDLRFVNGTETTELPYHIYQKSDGVSAQIRVMLPQLAQGNQSIYMYYGNPGVLPNSNANTTYPFYLDCSGTGVYGGFTPSSISGGTCVFDGTSGGGAGNQYASTTSFDVSEDWVVDMEFNANTGSNDGYVGLTNAPGDGSPSYYGYLAGPNFWQSNHFGTFANLAPTFALNTFYNISMYYNSTRDRLNISSGFQDTRTGSQSGSRVWAMRNLKFINAQYHHLWIVKFIEPTMLNYSFGPQELNSGVQIALQAPNNAYVSSNINVTFIANQSSSGSTILSNSTFNVWDSGGTLVFSNTSQISNQINQTINIHPFADGDYTWGAEVRGNDGTSSVSANRTFSIDTVLPVVNISSPLNGTEFATLTVPYNVSINFSIIENHAQACWFFNETANITVGCGGNASSMYGAGYHTAIIYANDTAGNVGFNQTSFLINLISPNLTYPNPVIESQPFNATFSIAAGLINSLNATLTYNGTVYPMSVITQNSTFASVQTNVTAPGNISTNQIVPLLINYTLNGNQYVYGPVNQSVLTLTPIVIATACTDKAIAFNALDEQNLTALNISIDYNFKFGFGGNNTLKTVYGSLTNVDRFYLCINSSVSNAYSLGYGEIDYQATGGGYVLRRYYTFEGQILTNSTQNVTLYDLANGAATSFLFEAKDQTLNPYVQKFLGLIRWYPQLNNYNLVEMAQTDENGRSIMRVKAEDVDYRVALWEPNGTLIKLNDVTRFACLTQPCTYSFTVFPSDLDYTSATGIQQSLTFNETSSKFVYVWNDPSGRTQAMNLTVYRETGVAIGPICQSLGAGSIGVIQCDVSGYTGQLRAVVFRSASPAIPIDSLVWNLGQAISSVAANMGLFISAILAIAGFFIGIFNPVIGIIMQIVSLVPSLYLGSVPQSVLIGFSIMGLVIIHFMRRIFS